jgi:hypothetical protein
MLTAVRQRILEHNLMKSVIMDGIMKTTKKLKSLTGTVEVSKPVPAPASPVRVPAGGPARVSLELVKPEARKVYVAGSFNEWKPETTPLQAVGGGRWKGDLALKPGRHEYLFVVDGQWLPDPNARETVTNPFGGKNSVLKVSA